MSTGSGVKFTVPFWIPRTTVMFAMILEAEEMLLFSESAISSISVFPVFSPCALNRDADIDMIISDSRSA